MRMPGNTLPLAPPPALAPALALAALLASGTASAGMLGDHGWSADGEAWGFCDPWTLPDDPKGCTFTTREHRAWVSIGRREALELWRPWEPAMSPAGTKPMLPVYPMDEDEDNPGPVKLSARLFPSDHVAEIWRLEGDVEHGTRGGEWRTIFEYSPDGLWLAAGAVHVDHDTSKNEMHVQVRPVGEWLALAENAIAMEELAAGRIRSGIRHLGLARRYLGKDEALCPRAASPEPVESPLLGIGIALDDVRAKSFARWSPDGQKLCVCEAWTDEGGGSKARCRMIKAPWEEWAPILVSLADEYCTPARAGKPAGDYHFVADGGYDGKRGGVTVYMTGGKIGPRMGAVVERTWDEPLKYLESVPAFFHAIGIVSPDGKMAAVGFMQEAAGDESSLAMDVGVKPVAEWVSMAVVEADLHARSGPTALDQVKPAPDLPPEK